MKKLRKNPHILWLGLAVIILLAEVAGFGHVWRRLDRSTEWFAHAHLTIEQLQSVMSRIKDAETGQRGYLITGREAYLEPYRRAVSQLPGAMAKLRRLADSPDQQKRLEELDRLVAGKLSELDQGIGLRNRLGFKAAAGAVETDQGMLLMQRIRAVATELHDREYALLQQRTGEADAMARLAYVISAAGWALLLVLFVVAAVEVHREMRRRQRLALLANEQSGIIQSAHEAIVTRDRERRILNWNAGATELYGWSEAEAAGRNIHELLKTRLNIGIDELYRILDRDGRWDGELLQYDRHGRELVVESRQVMARGTRGEIIGVLEMNRDITGRKRAEEALRVSRERLELVVGSIELGLFYCDLPFDKLIWNDICRRHFGVPADEEVTIDLFYQRVHPDDRDAVRRAIESCIAEGGPFDIVYRTLPPGAPARWIRAIGRTFRDLSGRPVRFDGVTVDVTAQRHAEEELRDGRERLMAALTASGTGTFRRYPATGALEWDENLCRIFGLPPAEAPRNFEAFLNLVHPEDRDAVAAADEKSAIAGGDLESECRIVLPDQSIRWIATKAKTFPALDGRPSYLTGACLDITERKRHEESLRQAQKLESIGLLAGGIAHDFNNLLVGIMGNASLAAETFSLRPDERAILQEVIQASERAADLTRQLLAYAGKGRFYLERVNFSELIRETHGLIRASIPKKVEVALDLAKVPAIEADRTQMQQVIMNLVINAGEAFGEHTGTVRISTATRRVDASYASSFGPSDVPPGEYVELEIQDTGCGMDADTLARIFDPFFTTKFTGRGLGLAAVQGIVTSHRGALRVYSSPGAGTVFKLLFPISTHPVEAAEAEEVETDLRGGATILVIDDELVVRKAARSALARYGYSVLLAANGREGVETFRREADRISLVLLDLTMPVMSGEETLAEMNRIRPGVRVVLSSGFNKVDAIRQFTGKGLAGFIQKPYTAAQLARAVKTVLESSQPLAKGKIADA